MKTEFQFTVTVNIDARKAQEFGDGYLAAFQETADEFAAELNAFLDRHPFIQSSKMEKVK
jgi:hypothetical protein